MLVKPMSRRSSVDSQPDRLTIVVPAARQMFVLIFLPIWLCGWAFGEASAARQLSRGAGSADLFLIVWLCGWTLGGAGALFSFLWNLAGREILILERGLFSVRREIFGIGWTRQYQLEHVSALRVQPLDAQASSSRRLFAAGRIAFDHGARTVRCGGSVDEAEAKQLVTLLDERIQHFRQAPIALR
jgi:hypothetical protein